MIRYSPRPLNTDQAVNTAHLTKLQTNLNQHPKYLVRITQERGPPSNTAPQKNGTKQTTVRTKPIERGPPNHSTAEERETTHHDRGGDQTYSGHTVEPHTG